MVVMKQILIKNIHLQPLKNYNITLLCQILSKKLNVLL